jgi:hypothetical protein
MDKLDQTVDVFDGDLGKLAGFESEDIHPLPVRSAGRSSIHIYLGSPQITRLTLQSPCMHLQPEALAADTPERVCRRDIAESD